MLTNVGVTSGTVVACLKYSVVSFFAAVMSTFYSGDEVLLPALLPKLTIWQACTSHTVIGQVCRGDKEAGRFEPLSEAIFFFHPPQHFLFLFFMRTTKEQHLWGQAVWKRVRFLNPSFIIFVHMAPLSDPLIMEKIGILFPWCRFVWTGLFEAQSPGSHV